MKQALPLAALLLASLACSSPGHGADEAPAAKPEGEPAGLTGVLTPAVFEAISLWPEEYGGELLVLQASAHGSVLDSGAVIAELDPRRLDEQLEKAELDLHAARVGHEGLLEKNRLAVEGDASRLAWAEAALERARRALEGYERREREFVRRSDELSLKREEAWEADQLDELEQLEAMYEADELVDATEEIVLKRQRRDVAMTKASNALSGDRRAYRVEVGDAIEVETRREDVAKKELELEHLRRSQAVEAAGREVAEARSSAELAEKEKRLERLRRDRELLTVRAPRAGILLHGSPRSLREAGGGKRVERGSVLSPRSEVFVVADPVRLAVALDLSETRRRGLGDGAVVTVRPLGSQAELAGTLSIAPLPIGAEGKESTFEATVELSEPAEGLIPCTHATVELGKPGELAE